MSEEAEDHTKKKYKISAKTNRISILEGNSAATFVTKHLNFFEVQISKTSNMGSRR